MVVRIGRALAAVAALAALAAVPSCTTSGGRRATETEVPAATATPVNTATFSASPTHTRTFSRTRTLSFTISSTGTPAFTWTPAPTWTPANSPTAFPTPVLTGTPVTIAIDCWSSANFCWVCSQLSYSCSGVGGWVPNCAFTDPCPGGQMARQIAAVVYGLPCTNPVSFATDVNGTNIGTTTNAAPACFCNSCGNWLHTSAYYSGGWPGWVSGGSNTFNFTSVTGGQICVSSVDLTIACQ